MQTSLQTGVNPWRWIIRLALVLLALVLAGCSMVRVGYNQAPTALYWWLDGYVDVNDAQAPRVHQALDDWLAWHRRSQLPDYAALLVRLQRDLLEPVTPAQVCAWQQELMARLDAALEPALPAIAELMVSLTPEQLNHVERRIAKGNQEHRAEFVQANPADRATRRLERTVDRAETLYGRLDAVQRERIAAALAESPYDAERWQVERQHRQREWLQSLAAVSTVVHPGLDRSAALAQAQAAVRVSVQRMTRSPRADYRAYQQRLAQANCALAATIHNLTRPAQRQAARARLKGWEDDLRILAAQGHAAAGVEVPR